MQGRVCASHTSKTVVFKWHLRAILCNSMFTLKDTAIGIGTISLGYLVIQIKCVPETIKLRQRPGLGWQKQSQKNLINLGNGRVGKEAEGGHK